MTEPPQPDPDETSEPAETPTLAQEDIDQIAAGAPAVQAALDGEPLLTGEIEHIIQERLRLPLTAKTLEDMVQALLPAMDDPTARYLLTVLFTKNDLYLAEVKARTQPPTWAWLRHLRMIHGATLQEAYYLWSEDEHSWRTVNRRMLLDIISGRWTLAAEIIKVNRERMLLEMSPDAALSFINALLVPLNTMLPEDMQRQLSQETVQTFMDHVQKLVDLYVPADDEAETDEPTGNGAIPPEEL